MINITTPHSVKVIEHPNMIETGTIYVQIFSSADDDVGVIETIRFDEEANTIPWWEEMSSRFDNLLDLDDYVVTLGNNTYNLDVLSQLELNTTLLEFVFDMQEGKSILTGSPTLQ